MRDAYGTRFGVIAGFSYGDEPFAYLFDIDASESVRLASAGVFDDVEQAAAAWRTNVGDTADGVPPRPVDDPQDLLCLSQLEIGDNSVFGDESRVVMDNWFRAQRRIHDLAELLPPAGSLFDDLDTTRMTAVDGSRPARDLVLGVTGSDRRPARTDLRLVAGCPGDAGRTVVVARLGGLAQRAFGLSRPPARAGCGRREVRK